MVNGKCERMDRCNNPELFKVVNDFAEAAVKERWRGPFNIQLKEDPKYGFQVIEPLKSLYKYQVREVARTIEVPPELAERQPFPGPDRDYRTGPPGRTGRQ